MSVPYTYRLTTIIIASVWLINGLFCKVLQLVPRHSQIVQEILQLDYVTASALTTFIGVLEIIMFIWIISSYRSKLNAVAQIISVATMNILEFLFVPELLLWGRLNALFAAVFIVLVYYTEFIWHKKLKLTTP
ncbi:DoxX-like family protein [Flavobacterium aurantiibacter]|uniref:DoxX-like family protein n=1 Tax=Flavobacterium aurantiibacter TaxID=2023067 RepID=UPI001A9CA0A4|nr:DoxX-like family protein [Flavobacterium aurantiibacter]